MNYEVILSTSEPPMILGMEIAMLVIGFLALVRGRLTITPTKIVEGVPARLLGMVAMTPLPLAFAIIIAVTISQGGNNPERFAEENHWTLVGIEAGVLVGIMAIVFGVGSLLASNPRKPRYDTRDDFDRYQSDDRPSDGRDRQPWER